MVEEGVTHDQEGGRVKGNAPTVKLTGEGGESAALIVANPIKRGRRLPLMKIADVVQKEKSLLRRRLFTGKNTD